MAKGWENREHRPRLSRSMGHAGQALQPPCATLGRADVTASRSPAFCHQPARVPCGPGGARSWSCHPSPEPQGADGSESRQPRLLPPPDWRGRAGARETCWQEDGEQGAMGWAVGWPLPLASPSCARRKDAAVCGLYPWGGTGGVWPCGCPWAASPRACPTPQSPRRAGSGRAVPAQIVHWAGHGSDSPSAEHN